MSLPSGTARPKIRVLVVDDSSFMRRIIAGIIQEDPDLEVIGQARDGLDALEQIKRLGPDVVTMDVQMPRLDGLATLARVMAEKPTPVVMVSSLTREAAAETVEALSLGALDVVAKPSGAISFDMFKAKEELIAKVKAASYARLTAMAARFKDRATAAGANGPDGQGPKGPARPSWPLCGPAAAGRLEAVLFIASSTGGPSALCQVLADLSEGLPAAAVVVQHMPKGFTNSLAARLNDLCPLTVTEAAGGEQLEPGHVYLAQGGQHLTVRPGLFLELDDGPPRHSVKPAADVTLETLVPVVRAARKRMVGAVLTGMGMDGARGMALLRKAGGRVFAQNEATSVVYGMPRAVVEMGLADEVLPLEEIGPALVRAVRCESMPGSPAPKAPGQSVAEGTA